MSAPAAEADPFDVRRALRAPGLLREFNDAAVLGAVDVHVALRLTGLAALDDEWVMLAAALAVRAPRLAHVHVDLETVERTAAVDVENDGDIAELPWPEPSAWLARVAASPLVAVGEEEDSALPLRLVRSALYLDRYWREERELAADLSRLADSPSPDIDEAILAGGLARLFAAQPGSRQALACASAVLRRLTVVAGGPGTGKTTTVAGIVALLAEQSAAAAAPEPLVALAAPTGKAAARLEEAVHEQGAALDLAGPVRAHLLGLSASTLHRLLGWRPDSESRFRHNRANRLPHDVVVVDESSMVSLSLMSRLVEAVRPGARLVLVGDPGQLASIEAGAVLADIVGPASRGLLMRRAARERLARVTAADPAAADPPGEAPIGDGIVVLDRVHRYGAGIAALAEAIRCGDPDAVIRALTGGAEGVAWIGEDAAEAGAAALAPVREDAVASGRALVERARAADPRGALDALGRFRVMCAHRRGAHGATTWGDRIEGWLAAEIEGLGGEGRWYPGRPLLVSENDYALRLYNGDTGVVVASAASAGVSAAFERGGEIVEVSPSRLGAADTIYAMTIHKSQGSQFNVAAVLLPPPSSRILTRELLYTAVTRASERLILVGTEETVRAAVSRPVARASGLGWRLWGGPPG